MIRAIKIVKFDFRMKNWMNLKVLKIFDLNAEEQSLTELSGGDCQANGEWSEDCSNGSGSRYSDIITFPSLMLSSSGLHNERTSDPADISDIGSNSNRNDNKNDGHL